MIFFSICSSIITTAAAAAKAMPRLQADFDTSFTLALPAHAAAYRARAVSNFHVDTSQTRCLSAVDVGLDGVAPPPPPSGPSGTLDRPASFFG